MKCSSFALVAVLSLGSIASAQFWPTVSTRTNMGTFSSYNIASLTSGNGLSAQNVGATHSTTWQEMWMSNRTITGYLQFDLGSVQPVSTIAVWNYNSSIGTNRGVALMDVSTSLDGLSFAPLSTERPLQALAQPVAAHLIDAGGVSARYIKFDILQNYGNSYTGLSEVQFVVNPCAGQVRRSGSGCQDSGGTPNTLTYAGCPDRGTTLNLELRTSASATGPLFLVMGFSDQNWSGIPLPLDLGIFGATGCSAYVSHTLVIGAPAPTNGLSILSIPMPVGRFLVGGTGFVQFYHLDVAANALFVVTSDYLALTVG